MNWADLFASKKFLASALAVIVGAVLRGAGVPMADIAVIVGPLLVYVGAQAVADIGKEKALIQQETDITVAEIYKKEDANDEVVE